MKSKSEMIDNIMDNFDFCKVAKCMKALNWKWWGIPLSENDGIPLEADIRATARKLLKGLPDVFLKDNYCTGTGGLQVNAWYENTEIVLLELSFVVTDWRKGV